MGLAGPKASTKISKDPRNTFWSKDTSRFGHQYLANLGWVPGQNLGDTSSSYHTSGHITDASSTGIKIVLKDDTLGIGAKKGAQSDECTGLLGLQGLLGRLNGDDKMVEQVKLEENRKKSEWIESRWGMRFVRGEIWVADDLTKLRERVAKEKEEKAEAPKAEEEKSSGERSSHKKRKRGADDEEKDKKDKKSKSKDRKKKGKRRASEEDGAEASATTDRESKSTSASGDETESKEERRARRKEEKRLKKERKEKRAARRQGKKDKKEKKKKRKISSDSDSSSESETEPASGSVTPASAMNGRHALRHRFIAAKRSAMMDAASLNEILMIKAQ